MAVAGNTEEVKTVLTIDTSKSASSMKELRTQIKQLKDELVGLDEGSQEYADTLVVLGEKMHQLREINEQVARTNTDFGDTIGNISNVMAGGVGAVQGLTASLSLLGFEMGDDNKLTQTLIKSMALLQSLSTMDKAIKSFKALSTVMKSNIAMAGGLGKALKMLAVSNPFTAILAAAVALLAVGAKIVTMFNDAKAAAEAFKLSAMFDETNASMKEMGWQLEEMTRKMKLEGKSQYEIMEATQKQLQKNIEDLENKSVRYYKALEEASKQNRESIQAEIDEINRLKQSYMDQREYNTRMRDILYQEEQKRQKEEEEKRKKERQSAYNDRLNKEKEALEKRYKVQDDAYKHELSLQKQAYEQQKQQIENRYNEDIILANGNADDIAKAEKRKADAMWKINSENYTKLIKLAEDYKKTVSERDNTDGSQTANLDALNETIISLSNSLDQAANDWQSFNHEQSIATAESERTKDALKAETEYINKQIELTKEHNERYLALISDRYPLQADIQAEAIRFEREQLLNDNTNIDSQLQALEAEHAAKLISEEEYLNQRAQLEQEAMENSARLRELDVEDEKNKLERKKELNEIYKEAISGILSSISNLLSAAADQDDISFEDQKRIKTAQALISTFEAATSAYSAMAGIPVVGPGLGAAAAAAAIAAGLIQVRKIQQTTKNNISAASAGTTGATQTVMTPPQIVNLNQDNIDSISLPDQRVYVVESDITDAQRRVNVVETNATI